VAGLQTRAVLFSLPDLAFPRPRTGLKTGHYEEDLAAGKLRPACRKMENRNWKKEKQ
jgi:hypothetical protein